MASHYVAIAKASFAAALLRPDPTSVSRDEIGRFHTLLEAAVNRCTPSNVQNCKNWLSLNVLQSTGRITAFGKYLAALSTSFGKAAATPASTTALPPVERPSLKRKRLHLLFVLNDTLHHAKYHTSNTSAHVTLSSGLQPQLVGIFTTAASFERATNAKHHERIDDILDLWAQHGYYSAQYVEKLRETVRNAGASDMNGQESASTLPTQDESEQPTIRASKHAPFIMPATHGDASVPYYDLPAGNMMPHIIPNSLAPINTHLLKPLQFVTGPADDVLVNVVKDFLKEVDTIYNGGTVVIDEAIVADIDEMGQALSKDDVTGELVATEGYYGWSIAFCERMKRRRRGDLRSEPTERRRERSRSRSGSSTPRKRRRYSSSGSSRNSSRRGYRSPIRSGSGYREILGRNGDTLASSDPRRSRSPTPLRSPSRGRHLAGSRSPSSSLPRAQPVPLNQEFAPPRPLNPPLVTPADQIDNYFPSVMPPPPVAPLASHIHHNFPIGPGGLPIPPPPPFHTGPWPPPPPNMPAGMTFNPGQYPNFSTIGFVPPPPPPAWQGGPTVPPPPPPGAAWPGSGHGQGQGHDHGHGQRSWGHGSGNSRVGSNTWQHRGQDPRRR